MTFALFSLGVTALFFISSLTLLSYGRRLGLRYLVKEGTDGLAGLRTVEGAVFALIGLLVAFTISGGLQRYDERRQLVVQEANAISTAYDGLALLERDAARELQGKLKDYAQARIELYRMPHDFSLFATAEAWSGDQQGRILERKAEIWDAAVAACSPANSGACSVVLRALANVFEVARVRAGAAEKHPPQIVYMMLFGLGLGGSLLAGFSMASAKSRSSIHMVLFAGTLAITLYVITDMEFPRLGLIRIDGFDHFLADVYEQMR